MGCIGFSPCRRKGLNSQVIGLRENINFIPPPVTAWVCIPLFLQSTYFTLHGPGVKYPFFEGALNGPLAEYD